LVGPDSSPISAPFPRPLPNLTIDLVTVMSDPVVLSKCPPEALQEGSIHCVYIGPESLECTVVLKTGDLFVYRLGPEENYSVVTDNELVSLRHIACSKDARYQPALMIPSTKGPVATFASSDIGDFSSKTSFSSFINMSFRIPSGSL
jgi:syntaxin-binding protein 5